MSAPNRATRARGGARVPPGRALARVGRALAVSLALTIAGTGSAASDGAPRWSLEIAGGVTNMQLEDMKSVYGQVVESYRSSGIPVEIQREFPANLIFGGDLFYGLNPHIRVGLGTRYTWSHAYSLYGDYSGTLDFVGEVRLLAVQGVLRTTWPGGGPWAPFAELRLGRGYVSIEMKETLVLTQPAAGSSEATLSGEGETPLAELHFGVTRSRGRLFWIGEAGYRFGKVPGPPFDVDVSGFVTSLGAGWSF